MTQRQKKFIDAYIRTGNAAESARRAGYAEHSARITAAKLLTNANISAAIRKELDAMHRDEICQAEENMRYLTKIVRGEYKEECVTQSGKVVKYQIPTEKRIRAAELLLKIQGKFKEATQSSAANSYLQAMRELEGLDDDTQENAG